MAIRGALEKVSEHGVSGWCVDGASDAPASVDVFIDSLLLGTVRADIPRKDIDESLGRKLAGFRFPFSPGLFQLLPHNARVTAVAEGELLAVMKGQDARIENPARKDAGQLLDMLSNGYIVGPKAGNIFRPLKERQIEEQVFDALEHGNRVFKELFLKEFFICYGTLLGCVRGDDFIEHDDDVDVCFLADGASLQEAAREFLYVIESLRAHGETISVRSNLQFHWWLKGISLDVFMAWLEDGRLYSYNVAAELSREQIYPLLTHKFKGMDVLIPREPQALLESIYGPGWTVPDPHFQWRPTEEARGKMREINSLALDHLSASAQIQRHWASFYSSSRTTIPSPFAASVALELPERCDIVDIGCGNARDSTFFAGLGHRVLGLDVSEKVIGNNAARAKQQQLAGIRFAHIDVGEPNALAEVLKEFSSEGAPRNGQISFPQLAVYARFLLHAITAEEEESLLETLSAHLAPGTPWFLEFRTDKDANTAKQFGTHYRRYIKLDRFVAKATAKSLFECTYRIEGRGLAKFRDEDPFVGRVHLRRL